MMATIQTRIGGGIRSLTLGRYRLVALILLLNLALSGVFFTVVQDQEQARMKAEFERHANTYVAAIQKGIERNLEVLESIGGLFDASAEVERQDFRAFVKGPLSRHQEIQALSWNQRVKDSDRASYEAARQNDGFPSFQITESKAQGQLERAERRAEYISVAYIEPLKGNGVAMGLDVASNTTRLAALESARDTGEMITTARITLVQETEEQFGILILKPVYKSGTPHETVEQRRQNLTGFAVGVFRIGDMVEASINTLPERIVNIQLVDEGSAVGERLLYLRQPSPGDGPTDDEELEVRDTLFLREPLEIPGRQWSLLISPTPEFLGAQASWDSWLVLAGGLIISVLLVAYLISMANHAQKTQRLADQLTKSNEDLEREITERTLAVEGLTFQAHLLENVNDAVISSNERFLTTAWNRAAEEMYGWTAEEILGRPTVEFLQPEFVGVEPDEVYRRLLEEGSFEGEVIHPRKGGTRIHTEARAKALRDKDGHITGFVSIDRDITERKRMEEELRQSKLQLEKANRSLEDRVRQRTKELEDAQEQLVRTEKLAAVGQLAGSVAHDLRSPMGAIRNAVHYLKRRLVGSELAQSEPRIGQFMGIIDEEIQHSNQILTDLLSFARVATPSFFPTHLPEVITSALSSVEVPENIQIIKRFDPDLQEVVADGEQLYRVFMNLTMNAQDAMPNGGELTISTRKVVGFAEVVFSDTGMGISDEEMEKIFEPLFTTKSKGTGLGLAICQQIVSKHSGTISVMSEPDQGATFVVSPNPPKDTEGRREGSGRGWVRELQGRWPGVLGQMGGRRPVFSRRTGPLRPYAGVAMRGKARGYAAGDSRDRGGARLRGRWVSCRLAVRPGTEWLAAGPRRD